MNSWGWGAYTSFVSTDKITFDIILPVTPTYTSDRPELRDWIGIRGTLNSYHTKYCCAGACAFVGDCCSDVYYNTFNNNGVVTDQLHSYMSLANSFTVGALGRNIGMET